MVITNVQMIGHSNILQGYKNSFLGIIPKDWEILRLGDVLDRLSNGLTYDVSVSEGLPVTRIETISTGEINFSKVGYISQTKDLELYKMRKGDILYSHINSLLQIGKVAYYNSEKELYHGMNLLLLRVNNKVTDKYLYYYLLTDAAKRMAQIVAKPAVNQASISTSDLKKVKIVIPPIEEQKKITKLLSEWDKAIELQTNLIEKLELRERAMMQRLFTGRIRLNGFSDKWKKKRLSEIGVFLSSNTLSREKLNKIGGHIQNIHYGDILIHYPTIVNPEYSQIPYVNRDVIVTSDLLQDGDIIFADTAEDNTVGKAIEIVNVKSRQIVAGLHTIPFRPNKGLFAKRFLGYYINSASYQKQLRALTQGIKVCSISKSSIKNTYLQIPSLAEQSVIAEVLISADKEIDIAKTKLSSLRNQKRGLMQQLLTGKKQVK